MEFWGIEIKPGETVKCDPGYRKLVHLSQASLGQTKKDKGSENALIFVEVNDQKLVLGTLTADKCARISYDVVFEKEFELSHSSKDYSVYFCGFKSNLAKVHDVDVDGTEVVGNNPLEEGANDAARSDGSGPGARKLSIAKGSRIYSHVADLSPSFRSGNLQDDLSRIGDSSSQGLQLLDQVNTFFKQVRRDSILATERLTRDGVHVQLEEARRSLDESEARREEAERLRAEAEAGRAAAEERLIQERAAAEKQLLKERAAWKESDKKRESMLTMAYKMLGSGLPKSKGASSHTSRHPK